jgi:exopolysaccharide biosynthesis protein
MKRIFCFVVSAFFLSITSFAGNGIRYRKVIENNPQNSIYIIEADPTKIKAMIGGHIGTSATTSHLCKEHAGDLAINGATFMMSSSERLERLYQLLDAAGFPIYSVYPSYGLKVNGEWWCFSSHVIGCVGWGGDNNLIFDTIHPEWLMHIGEIKLPIHALNHLREWEYGLYTGRIGSYVIIPKRCMIIKLQENKVVDVFPGRGYVRIPENGAVYCIPWDEGMRLADRAVIGKEIHIEELYDEKTVDDVPARTFYHWNAVDNVIASTPLLIKDGIIVERIKKQESEFYTARHPRTALGMKADGTWMLVVVDGRNAESVGMTMIELAEYMIKLGCVGAINFCGGGSSTMVFKDKVVNNPSGRRNAFGYGKNKERLLMQAIILAAREK